MTGPTQPYIDMGTLRIVFPGGKHTVTGEQWRKMVWPPCPKCGETVIVDRQDVTTAEQVVRRYIAGRWECPNECDPRTA